MGESSGRQQDQSRTRRAERERARPFLLRWLSAVEAKVANKRLGEFHLRLAKKLTNYPSANIGKSYPGQDRLGSDLGKAPRTVRAGLKDMRDEGLLIRKRGGPGQTATQWFAIKGKMLFDTAAENTIERGQVVDFPMRRRRNGKPQDRQDSAGLERQDSACLDRQDSAAKPFEQHPFEQHPIEPPLSPKSENATAELATGSDDGVLPDHHACGETARSLARKEVETVLNGEIVGPVTFSDFWNGSRRRSDNKDKPGPARKAFEMLSTEERQEITALLDRDGEIDLGGEWSCIWLRTRAWREAQLRKSGIAGVFEALRPRPGSREDRQEMTANSRRQFREWAWREDSATGDNNTLVAAQLGYGIASCPPGQYPIIEHTRAFEEWCQHYRRNRRVPPLAIDIVDQHGKRSRGFYKPTPYPPDDDDDGVSV